MKKETVILIFLAVLAVIISVSRINLNERKKKEREQFVKDSIAHDPRRLDSIAEARRRFDEWYERKLRLENEHSVAIVKDSDRSYHTSTECYYTKPFDEDYESFNIRDYHLIVVQEAIDSGYELCPDCEEITNTYYKSFDEE